MLFTKFNFVGANEWIAYFVHLQFTIVCMVCLYVCITSPLLLFSYSPFWHFYIFTICKAPAFSITVNFTALCLALTYTPSAGAYITNGSLKSTYTLCNLRCRIFDFIVDTWGTYARFAGPWVDVGARLTCFHIAHTGFVPQIADLGVVATLRTILWLASKRDRCY